MNKLNPKIALVIVACTWGISFPLMPGALSEMGTGFFLLTRFMSAYLIVSLIYRKSMRTISFPAVSRGIILGALLFTLNLVQTRALSATSGAGLAAGLGLSPLLVPLLAIPILKQKPTKTEITGCILTAIGIITFGSIPGPTGIIAMILFSLYLVLTSSFVKTCAPEHLVCVQLAVAAFCSMFTIRAGTIGSMGVNSWWTLLFVGVVATAWGLSRYTSSLTTTRSCPAAAILAIQTVASGILRDPIGPQQLVSILLVATGCIIASVKKTLPPEKES